MLIQAASLSVNLIPHYAGSSSHIVNSIKALRIMKNRNRLHQTRLICGPLAECLQVTIAMHESAHGMYVSWSSTSRWEGLSTLVGDCDRVTMATPSGTLSQITGSRACGSFNIIASSYMVRCSLFGRCAILRRVHGKETTGQSTNHCAMLDVKYCDLLLAWILS